MSHLGSFPSGETTILLAALALTFAGIGLVFYGARMASDAISRRVDLVRPKTYLLTRAAPLAKELIRSVQRGTQERENRVVVKLLSAFGLRAGHAAMVFVAIRLLAMAAVAGLAYAGAARWSLLNSRWILPFLVAGALGLVGWFIPSFLVDKAIAGRTKAIVSGLPDALELLVICVEAGLSFEDGIDRISVVLRKTQPALAEELALTAADMKILPSRDAALANLAGRVDAPSVRAVVTTLAQTLRYGTPLSQALRRVAAEMRTATLIRLQERANQLPALMTIPMMLFIMPTIFMITAGPVILKVMDSLKPH